MVRPLEHGGDGIMESLEVNKIVGAILTVSVVAMLCGFIAELIFAENHGQTLAYALAPAEEAESTAGTAAPMVETVAMLLAAADAGKGISVAKKCSACHTFDEGGKKKIGPNLWNILNRNIASDGGFSYSSALKEKAGETWSYESLDAFLAKPKDWAKGTKMSFAGIKKPTERADLILYLRSLSGAPAALPEG